ncbi:IS3 family transposase [Clostridium chromiireducens]|nr:IS3 family transposase [Clostridium chromiireducens]
MRKKSYTEDFKKIIIEVYNTGKPIKEICEEYGVSTTSLNNWINQVQPKEKISKKPIITTNKNKNNEKKDQKDIEEISKLKKENEKIKMELEILKKAICHILARPRDIIKFIDDNKENYPVRVMCRVLHMPKSTYYKSHHYTPSRRALENENLKQNIFKIYTESNRRYGAPKIQKILEQSGYYISIKRVQRFMKQLNIHSIVIKKFRPAKVNRKVIERENLLKQDFTATKINEKWVGDITYIYTLKDGWCYLASVMDLYTRKIIGYSFSKTIDSSVAIAALDNAYRLQQPVGSVIFHSDLGVQYTSTEFINRLKKYRMKSSNSRKGCPYDNACIESFHSILKKEQVNNVQYYDYESAKLDIFVFIESWYNRKRIHGSIGYITPQMKEDLVRLII